MKKNTSRACWRTFGFSIRCTGIAAESGGQSGVQRFFWKATDIQERLQDIISDAFHRTLRFATEKRTSMRLAAMISGIDKVAQAHLQRGL